MYCTNGSEYGDYRFKPEGFTECIPPPSSDHLLADNWDSDPMNAAICWRTKTALEIDVEKDAEADIEAQFDPTLKAFALVLLSELNILRAAAGLPERTIQQLKNAVKAKI